MGIILTLPTLCSYSDTSLHVVNLVTLFSTFIHYQTLCLKIHRLGNLSEAISSNFHSVLKIFLQKTLGRFSSFFFWQLLLLLGCTRSHFLRKNRHKYREREIQIQKKNFHLLLAANAPAWPYSLKLSQRQQTQIQRERNTNTEEE